MCRPRVRARRSVGGRVRRGVRGDGCGRMADWEWERGGVVEGGMNVVVVLEGVVGGGSAAGELETGDPG